MASTSLALQRGRIERDHLVQRAARLREIAARNQHAAQDQVGRRRSLIGLNGGPRLGQRFVVLPLAEEQAGTNGQRLGIGGIPLEQLQQDRMRLAHLPRRMHDHGDAAASADVVLRIVCERFEKPNRIGVAALLRVVVRQIAPRRRIVRSLRDAPQIALCLLRLAGAQMEGCERAIRADILGSQCERSLERSLGGLEIPDVLIEVRQGQLRADGFRVESHGLLERVFRFLLIPPCKPQGAEIDARAFALRLQIGRPLGKLHGAGQIAKTGQGIAKQDVRFEI